ncbi:MAG: hypothetical protein ABI863_05370, partial [Ginsengibacter sp.]
YITIKIKPMIRKLKSGEYRLYSRKKDPKTNERKPLGTFKPGTTTFGKFETFQKFHTYRNIPFMKKYSGKTKRKTFL